MYPESLEKLIASFRMLPGVGEKTAERYALVMSEADPESVRQFSQALLDVKAKLIRCKTCGNLSEEEECDICRDQNRDHTQICVVQSPKDVIAFEKTGEYKGVYHVLGGLISSSKGVMPEDLNLESLLKRAADAREVILATSATLDGETTAMYLEKVLQNVRADLVITRISHGLPIGGLVDYADEMTLIHALADRRRME
jgi:recombination protein RecR